VSSGSCCFRRRKAALRHALQQNRAGRPVLIPWMTAPQLAHPRPEVSSRTMAHDSMLRRVLSPTETTHWRSRSRSVSAPRWQVRRHQIPCGLGLITGIGQQGTSRERRPYARSGPSSLPTRRDIAFGCADGLSTASPPRHLGDPLTPQADRASGPQPVPDSPPVARCYALADSWPGVVRVVLRTRAGDHRQTLNNRSLLAESPHIRVALGRRARAQFEDDE
jgi:hypothetical protein